MRIRQLFVNGTLALTLAFGAILATAQPAEASIHEIIAALCRGEDLGEVIPPGQNRDGQSFVRALQATGFITSIEETATAVIIHFDTTVPNSKFMSAGFDLTLEDEIAPGVDLVLSPLPIPDPSFPAHARCRNLR